MIVEFEGEVWGDSECMCFKVSEDTYRRVCGEEAWKIEKDFLEECDELKGSGYSSEPIWLLYLNDLLGYSGCEKDNTPVKVKFDVSNAHDG